VNNKIYASELRVNYVHAHAVTLHAIGIAGRALLQAYPDDWSEQLQRLRQIDWSRSNAQLWEGRAMSGGQMSKTRQHLRLTANLLKTTMGLELTAKEQEMEKNLHASASKE
jgi:DNA sulfur modification protein DndB